MVDGDAWLLCVSRVGAVFAAVRGTLDVGYGYSSLLAMLVVDRILLHVVSPVPL